MSVLIFNTTNLCQSTLFLADFFVVVDVVNLLIHAIFRFVSCIVWTMEMC